MLATAPSPPHSGARGGRGTLIMRQLLCSFALVLLLTSSIPAQVPSRDTPMDKAIDRALQFLANTQDRSDGSWKGGGTRSPAITSLAVMAFLSAGHVPGEGRYGDAIEKGVRWVLKAQQPN